MGGTRCTRCAIDVPDDAERCPKCLRSSSLASATTSSTGPSIGWGALRREREAPLGWAPTIMAIGFLVIVAFATYAVQSDLPDWAVMRWSSIGALALVYGFKRELDAIGLARTLGVFLVVCLVGALVVVGCAVLVALWLSHASWKPPTPILFVLGWAPSIVFVVGTWWVARRLDRARLEG